MDNSGIVTNEHGLLARFSILPAGSGAPGGPLTPGYSYRPLGPLRLDDELDALLADLFQGPVGSSSKSPLRGDLEDIVAADDWSLISPFRVGYQVDDDADGSRVDKGDNELTLLFIVQRKSVTVDRAVEVVVEARKVLAR